MTRTDWTSILALSNVESLSAIWDELSTKPRFAWIRRPEYCAVMVRARICADGSPFNAGEVAITRCSLQLTDAGHLGVAYVVGRSRRHAALAAVFDAMAQDDGPQGEWTRRKICRLRDLIDQRRNEARTRASRTAVDFSMLLREGA